jgi:hypothetical protein
VRSAVRPVKTWLDARRLDMQTPVKFVSDNDIVGGKRRQPDDEPERGDRRLVFDGNIHSISGSYRSDAEKDRPVSVHPAFIKTALHEVYDMLAIARELEGVAAGKAAGR